MDTFRIVKCRETGICSIIKKDGTKVDSMPDEVSRIQENDQIKAVIAEVGASFAANLNSSELNYIASKLK